MIGRFVRSSCTRTAPRFSPVATLAPSFRTQLSSTQVLRPSARGRLPWARFASSPAGGEASKPDLQEDPPKAAAPTPEELAAVAAEASASAEPAPLEGGEEHNFAAETSKLLDIVSSAIYTDREVFLRELISNASDALEKARYHHVAGKKLADPDKPLEVRIDVDTDKNTITIQDSGIGMTKSELIDHLGVIARSGSQSFVSDLSSDASRAGNIIGQFGVGFYSSFMVSTLVEVFSKSATELGPDDNGTYWRSKGHGAYEIAKSKVPLERGTKIVLHLKDDAMKQFGDKHTLEQIAKRYSNFVGFPIFLNGAKVNTLGALWLMDKDEVTAEQHEEFFKSFSGSYQAPAAWLHFKSDVPLSLSGLLYVPADHSEQFGLGRMEPGVDLYSRKVLIQAKSDAILPPWLRWVRGVVDSDDLPLHVSREKMQNSQLMARLNAYLVRQMLRHLETQMRDERPAYVKFFAKFGKFLKEGVCTDPKRKDKIAPLLLFETSQEDEQEDGEPAGDKKKKAAAKPALSTLDDYVSRMPAKQERIYFLSAPSRAQAVASPYMDLARAAGAEVLFVYEDLDDFVLEALAKYGGKDMRSVSASGLDDLHAMAEENDDDDEAAAELSADQQKTLGDWIQATLADKVSDVGMSKRLRSSPAVIVDHESAALRRMMRAVGDAPMGMRKAALEINPKHAVVTGLWHAKEANPKIAKLAMEQVFENALTSAGLQEDPRAAVPRLNELIGAALRAPAAAEDAPAAAATDKPVEEKKAAKPKKTSAKAKKAKDAEKKPETVVEEVSADVVV